MRSKHYAFLIAFLLPAIGCNNSDLTTAQGLHLFGAKEKPTVDVFHLTGTKTDTLIDIEPDTPTDTSPDTPADTPPDILTDASTDASTDTPTDIPVDTEVVWQPDDYMPDNGGDCSAIGNVANLKSCQEGAVDLTLQDVTVTYVFEAGYYVQDASGGIEIYMGDEWEYEAPTPGDVIDLHVTELANFKGQQEAYSSEAPIESGSVELSTIIIDLSPGVLPSEDNESMIVTGNGLLVEEILGKSGTLAYGGLTGVPFRFNDPPGTLCTGAVFDLTNGVITQYDDEHRVTSWFVQDITNINYSGCEPGVESDDSNWGFEETNSNDPPSDFEKITEGFTATWTTDEAHTGSQSCALTWTSQDNQDFAQGFYLPISTGETASFIVWVKDLDEVGRVRMMIRFYNAGKNLLSSEWASDYSDDGDWTEMTFQVDAPPDTAFARGIVRMYDVSEAWDGDATVYIDDWSMSVNQ